jgi:predicted nucleic acid-binding Zn ribbon protein
MICEPQSKDEGHCQHCGADLACKDRWCQSCGESLECPRKPKRRKSNVPFAFAAILGCTGYLVLRDYGDSYIGVFGFSCFFIAILLIVGEFYRREIDSNREG